MSFALYRAKKLKSQGAMRGSVGHTARTRETLNADPARLEQNRQLIGFEKTPLTPDAFIKEWERRTRGVLKKPDAVLCQELFLGVSPSFFSECADMVERQQRLEAWKSRTVDWLRDTFGNLVISATLHVDETTPHLCAYVVPLRPSKDGKLWLGAKHLFNRRTLREQQDSYASALADLGIQRGVQGSKAKHTSIQSFYAKVNAVSPLLPSVETVVESIRVTVPEKGVFETSSAHRDRVVEVVTKQTQVLVDAARQAESALLQAAQEKSSNLAIQATNRSLSRKLVESQARLKELSSMVRDIPLDDVMRRLGFGDPVNESGEQVWRTGEHVIAIKGPKWFDFKANKGGGKAIDLVKHVMGCPFQEAVGWLAGHWTETEAVAAVRAAAVEQVRETPKKDLKSLWRYFAEKNSEATRIAQEYLVGERRIPENVVRFAISQGLVHGSFQRLSSGELRSWCVFPHRTAEGLVVGASLRATDAKEGSKKAIGSKTKGFFSIGPSAVNADELVLVESPIDAMSYFSENQGSHVISVGGNSVPDVLIPDLATSTKQVVIALDNDQAGTQGWNRLLERLKELGGDLARRLRRLAPSFPGWPCKDWNDVLKAKGFSKTENVVEKDRTAPRQIKRVC